MFWRSGGEHECGSGLPNNSSGVPVVINVIAIGATMQDNYTLHWQRTVPSINSRFMVMIYGSSEARATLAQEN